MLRFLEHRIADRRVIRLIRKWLEAGVIESGKRIAAVKGTPQGAVISPLLANIYRHYAFDLWIQHWRKTPGQGEVIVTRYADDSVVGFENVRTAEAFLAALQERFGKFGLTLHPDKTRLIEFGRYAAERRRKRGRAGQAGNVRLLGIHALLWNRPTR
jgi:RNA-directed DNA polymerase